MKKICLIIALLTLFLNVNAQRGKDGNKTVTGSEVVNAYTSLSADASAGDTLLQVTNSDLNTNFSATLAPGDLIMIIQIQGASIEDGDKFVQSWGGITGYNNCGNYEFAQVKDVPNNTSLVIDCGLQNDYTQAGKTMVVRVPRYNNLTINVGNTITGDAWNGSTGGIIAIEVLGTSTIDGVIDVSGLGFRGGQTETASVFGGLRYADGAAGEGAEKGEGIAGSQTDYDNIFSGRFCRGSAANGGGGGNGHNAGGAGGANAGDISIWNKGIGNPDVSSANFITAWTRDTNITLINADPTLITSSGGGRGGYSHCSTDRNEINVGPNDPSWTGDFRRDVGGLGGRPLDYSTGKIFMGGAGGAGDANDIWAGEGGNGAGIIFLKSYDNISGSGSINANGADGGDCFDPNTPGFGQYSGKDAAGGGGAGGTIMLQTTGTVSGVTLNANGGKGGDQIMNTGTFGVIQEAEGPGGGGGGGYTSVSAGSPTMNVAGGVNGITTSPYMSNFNPNGATIGGVGISSDVISSFNITANDASVCPNQSANLTATVVGSLPGGTTIEWYDAEFNGNLLQTGNNYSTPNLLVNTTYYIKTCPGDFTVPVNVTINACATPPVADFGASDSTLCVGDCISFTDLTTNTPSGWTWYFFGADSTNSNQQNPTNICYNTAGNFDVALVASNPAGSDSLFMPGFITVSPLPTIVMTPDTAICIGDTIDLTASGGTNYTWNNGLGSGANHTVIPSADTSFQVTVTDNNGCLDSSTVNITVNSLPTVVANANNTSICTGDSLMLYGTGADSYVWDNSVTDSVKFVPASTNTYTVIGTDLNNCSNTDQIVVTVGSCGVPPVVNFGTLDTNLCIGDCISFTDSSSNFPTNWTWYLFGADSTNSNQQNPNNICYNTAGSFDVALVASNAFGQDSLFIANYITVNDLPTITASIDTTICTGDTANISATGGVSYTWDNGLGNGQNQSPTPTVITTYTVTATDINGCENTSQVTVSINALPTVTTSPDTIVCSGSPANLSASGGVTYLWDNGLGNGATQSPTPSTNTTYTVIVTDANNCTNTGQINVTVNALPTITANNDTAICNGNSVTVSATGGVLYNWDNGLGLGPAHNVTPLITTTYIVTGADGNGCTDTDQITVTVSSCTPPVVNFGTLTSNICIGDCISFNDSTLNNPTSWTWYFFGADSTISTQQNPNNICYNTAGSFDVALVGYNTFGQDSLFMANYVTVNDLPTITITGNDSVCMGESITLTANGATSYVWDNGLGNGISQSVSPIVPTTYTVTGQDANNCINTGTFTLNIKDCPVTEVELVVPNVFTPNVDGNNDLFNITGTGIKALSLKIFNRWGTLIFETQQLNEGWNGRTSTGKEVPEGTYFYIANVITNDGEENLHGSITLIR